MRHLPVACVGVVTLALALSCAGMPEPRPVPTTVKVGCYYFPGHFNAARWAPMKSYGHPRPLLGHYRDGAPGVSDWHIKWKSRDRYDFPLPARMAT